MNMKKWKQRVIPLFLTAVMVAGSAFAGIPEKVQAADENEGFLQSKITYGGKNTYLAYNDGTDDQGIKNIFTWTGSGDTAEPNQFYTFEETEDGTGIYTLVNTADPTDAVSVDGISAGSSVVVEDTPDSSDTKQQWTFEAAEDGYYYMKNVASGLYMTTPRTQDSDTTEAQYLTIEEKNTENGDSQLWKPGIAVNEYEPEPAETVEGWLSSGAASGMYLAVDGGTAEEGKGIILWTGPETNQEWQFQPAVSGTEYYIVNITTNKALSSPGTDENQQLVQYTKNEDDASQLWIFEETGTDGAYYIRNKATGLYVTASGMCQVIVGTFSYLLMSVYFFYFQIIPPALLSPTFISFSRRLFQRLFSMLSALHPEVAYDV